MPSLNAAATAHDVTPARRQDPHRPTHPVATKEYTS